MGLKLEEENGSTSAQDVGTQLPLVIDTSSVLGGAVFPPRSVGGSVFLPLHCGC